MCTAIQPVRERSEGARTRAVGQDRYGQLGRPGDLRLLNDQLRPR